MKAMLIGLALAAGFAVPAMAQMSQDSTSSGSNMSNMKMSAMDMKMMKRCQKMSHGAMMKNKRCASMMKMHPDMMKSDGSMKDGMMKGGG